MLRATGTCPNDGGTRIVVPFAPGGTTDILARIMAARLQTELKQTVIVENRPGAGGNSGRDVVAKAVPDGYTVGIGAAGALAFAVLR